MSSASIPPARVSVLTMSPGDAAFARFGHNAILLEWPALGTRRVYNFGTFAFHGMDGVRDFMAGRFRYWLSVSTLERTLLFYGRQNRSITAQELDLDPTERAALADALEKNALPENRFYDYDYYKDNCSTRVRDAIDQLLKGELAREIRGAGRLSFRGHTERLTADAGWLYPGLDIALGPLTDRPTTRWEELFIPAELHDALARAKRHVNGQERPLVLAERELLSADREPVRSAPPARVALYGALGVVLGGAVYALGRAARTTRAARVLFGSLSALIGLVLGLLGTVFVVFWAFTKHWSAYRNENILVCPPFAVALLAAGIGFALGRDRAGKLAFVITRAALACALVAVLLALIPHFGQDNTRMAAFFAPLWLGLYLGTAAATGLAPWPRPRDGAGRLGL
ncbi:MAG TPA: DUF4105 domain-containing protein [Polyangiaceae bacterium]|nr:DUF4105 domain-containing protein [Polyangiaceae bacterium]